MYSVHINYIIYMVDINYIFNIHMFILGTRYSYYPLVPRAYCRGGFTNIHFVRIMEGEHAIVFTYDTGSTILNVDANVSRVSSV